MILKYFTYLTLFVQFTVQHPLGLTENEVHQFAAVFKEVFNRHQIPVSKEILFNGSFQCSPPEDCAVTIDVSLSNSNTENGVLSGNDVLNGIGNGNGNNNGNVVLQIFNIPPDDKFGIPTTTEGTTFPWTMN